ncbi:TPA: DUF927 domain-containing protein [Salmonella enterica subsp. diarizonae serovar 61:r:-]
MKNIGLIREVTQAAAGRWPFVLAGLNISVPDSPRKHAPCPVCGGKDRFRFDDGGRGSFFCNQCGAGDGLDLIQKVNHCNATEAAVMVADVLSIDYREAETDDTASQRKDQREAERRKTEQERRQQAAAEAEKRQALFSAKYRALAAKSVPGQSAYLTAKGLEYPLPLLPDDSLLVALTNGDGTVTGAQTITPEGDKRLVAGTVKKGAFFTVNASDNPQTVIIGEGLATVLSVHLMRPDAMAVAAIDAGNLLPVATVMRRKYPDAQIIIAADNDIRPGESNTGKDAAEKAAKSISGWMTLPPGEHKADWNDFHQLHGLDAATAAFNDSVYQPEGEKMAVKLKAIEGGKKRRSRETHIQGDELKPRVESRINGVYWIAPKVDKETGEIINNETWLSSPLEVIGTGSDDARQYYFVLRWKVPNRTEEITRALPAGDVGEREGWRSLKSGGVKVIANPRYRGLLSDWIQQNAPAQEWGISHRAGWFRSAYIMPDGEVIGEPENPVMFNGGSAAASGYTVSGTPESWRDSVARLAGGNPMMMLGVAASLAAPLIGLVNADGFGVHLFDNSTAGKTTTADIAASVWGSPDLLRLTWYGTALGIANEAEAHNDSLLPMDEIGQGSSAKDVATSAYTLFNGTGKLQGAKEGGNRELRRWRTVAISTGEKDIGTFLAEEGIRAKAGQLVRLLNIPMEKSTVHHEYGNGERHAKALKAAYTEHYGATGREWVKWLASHQQEAKDAVKAARERWCGLIPENYGEQVKRVADRFAILEAALIAGQHLTGWSEQASRDAMQHCFNAWVSEFGTGSKEHQQIIGQCEAFLNRFGFSRYLPYPDTDPRDLPIKDLAGYRVDGKQEDELSKFYTWPSIFEEEISAGFNPVAFGKALAIAGMLERGGDRLKKKALRKIGGRQQTFYVLMYAPDEDGEEEQKNNSRM